MSLLIDGYNLLHAAGIFGGGKGPGHFERARTALLNFVAATVEPRELPRTIVVFDAVDAPPGLPHMFEHRGLQVRFACQQSDADELLEELILADTSPRQLTVVSSDHRVQRAAKRRRARAVDSDVWYAEVAAKRRSQGTAKPSDQETRLKAKLEPGELESWLAEFAENEDFGEDFG